MKNENINNNTERVLDAITALKEKADGKDDSYVKDGVDLLNIVKKLSRNREKRTHSDN